MPRVRHPLFDLISTAPSLVAPAFLTILNGDSAGPGTERLFHSAAWR